MRNSYKMGAYLAQQTPGLLLSVRCFQNERFVEREKRKGAHGRKGGVKCQREEANRLFCESVESPVLTGR